MTNSQVHDSSYDSAIALIGMSGRFPGAPTIETFWQNIAAGVTSIRVLTDEELLAAGVNPTLLAQPNYVKAGAPLEDITRFDAAFFGYTPREAEIMDPQHRLFLECAWEALEQAGYDPSSYRGLIGVFAGSAFSSYLFNNLYPHGDLLESIGQLQIDAGNDRDSLASMVSYKLNLKGPGVSVQTFCSTSLVAVHLACQSLLNYESDIALAGGVSLLLPHGQGYVYEEGGILSPDGQCRAFDRQAQGSVVGSGSGVVVLKRLREALEDGDEIVAVLRGSAINNDGSLRVSYTAPGVDGQANVILGALSYAGVSAESISYIEAHGTGTKLGDAVELAAMRKAFAAHTQRQQFCAIGSVKPNVGHLDRASGVTGLIKASLALKHKQLPPSVHFVEATQESELAESPFYVNTRLQEWLHGPEPRRAGVSSFGLGGTNAHVVLEEAPEREPSSPSRQWQLLLLSARTEAALQAATSNLADHLQAHPDLKLADAAYTLQIGRSTFAHRRVLVCREREDALAALQNVDPKRVFSTHQEHRDRPVAFMFPGVGEHYVGLSRELYEQEPVFREAIDHCCTILEPYLGRNLWEVLYEDDPHVTTSHASARNGRTGQTGLDMRALLGRNGTASVQASPLERLKQTALAQPAVFVIEYALAQLLMQWGIRPQAVIGYSLGEYVAACLAGVISLEDALRLVACRAQLIQATEPGAMIAVALSEKTVQPYLDEQICLAAMNGPSTCVLSGPVEAIALLEEQLSELGIIVRQVETTHAFHSSMLEQLMEPLTALVRGITLHPPQIPYISNVTGTWITDEQAVDPHYWARHMCQTVRFADGIRQLLQDTNHVLLEVGPGQSLSAFAKQHPDCTVERLPVIVSTLPTVYERQSDLATVLNALGKLWLAGAAIDWAAFSAGERRYRVHLPTYPFERLRYWVDAPVGRQEKRSPRPRTGKIQDIADWFYLPTWEQSPLSPAQNPPRTLVEQSPWLIFMDDCGLGEQMARRLEQAGHICVRVHAGIQFTCHDEKNYTLHPGKQADYRTLCKALAAAQLMPHSLLHCWSVTQRDEAISGPTGFQAQQERGFYSLLFLAQALEAQVYQEPVQCIIVSNAMQAVTAQEVIHPEKATIQAACRIIPQEQLNITCRCVDIMLDDTNLQPGTRTIDQLFAECTGKTADLIVAFRQRQRWIQTYKPVRLERPSTDAIPFRKQGVYLITGGMGGVGLLLAEHLARTVQARLIITGRSGLPAREQWQPWLENHAETDSISRKIRQLQAIEALGGEVLVIKADVANTAQMHAVIAQTYERFGTLHGVIHAAGVTSDDGFRLIQDSGPTECELQFQPKVHGLYALEQALHGLDLDFCLLFSSISTTLGGLGFLGYAAANIFMDAYTCQA